MLDGIEYSEFVRFSFSHMQHVYKIWVLEHLPAAERISVFAHSGDFTVNIRQLILHTVYILNLQTLHCYHSCVESALFNCAAISPNFSSE